MPSKAKTDETGVSQDMIEAAKADLEQKKEEAAKGLRTFKSGLNAEELRVSDLYEFPAEFDLDGIAPVSYLAQPEGEITGDIHTQKFSIREERLKGLVFDKPARRLEKGRALRVIKALKPNGILGQIPFEGQINNTAAGDMSDGIGVKKFQRKGWIIFFDFETMQAVYCMARNCWAAAMVEPLVEKYPEHASMVGSGYCSKDHFEFTERNHAGMFSTNVTTTKTRGY